jgi:hypothetical protein
VLNCARDNPFQYGTIDLKAGIGIALYQIGLEFAVYEEVKTEQLKVMILPLRIQELKRCP